VPAHASVRRTHGARCLRGLRPNGRRALVEQVHETLGRHRADDPRTVWISGLGDEEGRAHPTRGGLRIGKERSEREPGEPLDERGEWDHDGPYFHYLIQWMHALARVADVSGESRYVEWAIELARAAKRAFTYERPDGRHGLVWKMSIDLTRPLVPTMSQHDALSGLLTFRELQAASASTAPVLEQEVADLKEMCAGAEWTTADPLGLGGLLCDAYRLGRLVAGGHDDEAGLLPILLRTSAVGLAALARHGGLAGPASQRLAFRELGLSIGLQAVPRLSELLEEGALRSAAVESDVAPAPIRGGGRVDPRLLARDVESLDGHLGRARRHQHGHARDEPGARRSSLDGSARVLVTVRSAARRPSRR